MSSISSPTLLAPPAIDNEIPDAYLLREFVEVQDEEAFAALVQRHGGLVRGVCRRILTDPAASDDAFQQTFLSLAKNSRSLLESLEPAASLGSWLYRVAVNAALQWKRKTRSRRRTETQFASHRPAAQSPNEPWNDVLPALDEEISSLPGLYRSAVVKCHLEGKTQQDAAKELGITYATLRRRLKEARGMLRHRLTKRGFTQNGFLLIPLLGQMAVPEVLSAETVSAVTATAIGKAAATTTSTTAAVSAASSAATTSTASVGVSLSVGTKLLAVNPLIKLAVAVVMMFSLAGGWWMLGSKADAESLDNVAVISAEDPAEDSAKDPELEDAEELDHFAYIMGNGQVASPEFESAVKALIDAQAKKREAATADPLEFAAKLNSENLLESVTLESPLPKNTDPLEQAGPAFELVSYIDPHDPNASLLLEDAKSKATKRRPDPLSVEQVMDFLNDEQKRRSQRGRQTGAASSIHVLGHHNTQPAKTLKVITFP